MRYTRRLTLPALALTIAAAAALMLAACAATGVGGTLAPTASAGIIRESLGGTLPGTAPGQRLGLWHYTIPAGSRLSPHTHPGWQVARIVSGTLSYTIISGEATVLRGTGGTETHETGETFVLLAGDTIVENPDLQHFGANNGTVPVEIYASSLFTDGQPPAIPLPGASPAAS
ncbi:MAG: hypothetical protein ACRDF7_05105 [Candidatus Limnocylindrales bacterium]